jgi:hypothetical protein
VPKDWNEKHCVHLDVLHFSRSTNDNLRFHLASFRLAHSAMLQCRVVGHLSSNQFTFAHPEMPSFFPALFGCCNVHGTANPDEYSTQNPLNLILPNISTQSVHLRIGALHLFLED